MIMEMPFKVARRALFLSRSLSLHQTIKQKRNASSIALSPLCDWPKEKHQDDDANAQQLYSFSSPLSPLRCRWLSSRSGGGGGGWSGARGYDITMESLKFGSRPKVIMDGYTPAGFLVYNTVKKVDTDQKSDGDGAFYFHGSIMAFPFGCFLWKVATVDDITLESLYPVMLHRPAIECLFIGCEQQLPLSELDRIRLAFLKQNIVVEQMSVGNAMGTFNILNAEDREVAVALCVASTEDE